MTGQERDALFESMRAAAAAPRRTVYLHPGDSIATHVPTAVKTILGSCISVCLWDCERAVGGMNHFVMPRCAARTEVPGRFGSLAIPRLIDAMVEQGARATRLQAKVFGGASMVPGSQARPNHVGVQNIKVASEILERAGIPVIACDVGGGQGRKIVFYTDDGSVALWTL
jgi:chemotaxis protein CheD